MKATLLRLKEIFGANFSFFITSAVISMILYGVELIVIKHNSSLDISNSHNVIWTTVFVSALFLLPIYNYVAFNLSRVSSGTKKLELDTRVMKRSLFIAAGIIWASLGWMIIAQINRNMQLLFFTSTVVITLGWHVILKMFIKYGYTL